MSFYTKFFRTLDEIEITCLSNELLRFIVLIKGSSFVRAARCLDSWNSVLSNLCL